MTLRRLYGVVEVAWFDWMKLQCLLTFILDFEDGDGVRKIKLPCFDPAETRSRRYEVPYRPGCLVMILIQELARKKRIIRIPAIP